MANDEIKINELQYYFSIISSLFSSKEITVKSGSVRYKVYNNGKIIADIDPNHSDLWINFLKVPEDKLKKILEIIMQPTEAADTLARFEEIKQEETKEDNVPF